MLRFEQPAQRYSINALQISTTVKSRNRECKRTRYRVLICSSGRVNDAHVTQPPSQGPQKVQVPGFRSKSARTHPTVLRNAEEQSSARLAMNTSANTVPYWTEEIFDSYLESCPSTNKCTVPPTWGWPALSDHQNWHLVSNLSENAFRVSKPAMNCKRISEQNIQFRFHSLDLNE